MPPPRTVFSGQFLFPLHCLIHTLVGKLSPFLLSPIPASLGLIVSSSIRLYKQASLTLQSDLQQQHHYKKTQKEEEEEAPVPTNKQTSVAKRKRRRQTLQTEEEDVDCTAIEEEEGGSKRNILQKTLSQKNYSLSFFATRRDWVG